MTYFFTPLPQDSYSESKIWITNTRKCINAFNTFKILVFINKQAATCVRHYGSVVLHIIIFHFLKIQELLLLPILLIKSINKRLNYLLKNTNMVNAHLEFIPKSN